MIRSILLLLVCVSGIALGFWVRSAYEAERRHTTTGISATRLQAAIDGTLLGGVLHEHVDEHGQVDYAALKAAPARLDRYIAHLQSVDLAKLDRDEQLALLINAYNAYTLRLIIDHYPVKSIRDIPEDQRWKAARWNIGGKVYSLDQIENELIRPVFKEPRIHFALVCAAESCPPLRREMYQASRLEEQLEEQTRSCLNASKWIEVDQTGNKVRLTPLLDWFAADFGDVLAFAAKRNDALRTITDAGKSPAIEFLPYDWSLNQQPK
jgi:hypothetical protein